MEAGGWGILLDRRLLEAFFSLNNPICKNYSHRMSFSSFGVLMLIKRMIEVENTQEFQEYLEDLLIQEESDELEFKSAAGGFPGSFWDTYSAFANTSGGVIVLGVSERNGRFFLDNLSDELIEISKGVLE